MLVFLYPAVKVMWYSLSYAGLFFGGGANHPLIVEKCPVKLHFSPYLCAFI